MRKRIQDNYNDLKYKKYILNDLITVKRVYASLFKRN